MIDKYQDYVRLGKELLSTIQLHQMKISEYALKVCDIRNGGITPESRYTLSKYAQDIGMNRKTLEGWVSTYKNVVIKLDKSIKDAKDWTRCAKVNDMMASDQILNNKIDQRPGRLPLKKRSEYSEQEVQKIYNEVETKPFLLEFIRSVKSVKHFLLEFIRSVKSVKHFLHLLNKRDLSIISDNSLIDGMNLLDECSDKINDYLTNKR